MSGVVLSLCDRTGNMVKPWHEAGYRCICVDLCPLDVQDGIERVEADVLRYLPPRCDYAAAFAFPVCTDLATSGARWLKGKGLAALSRAIALVARCAELCEWTGAPYLLENPVSTLATYWREPDYTFDPCDFGAYLDPPGDAYTKKTCLWVGGGFVMPRKAYVHPAEGSKMHGLGPSDDRADLRSVTPMGFARAVFEANHRKASAA